VVTEHTIHRDYCPKCKKHVEPEAPDALPRAAIGHNLISLTSWLYRFLHKQCNGQGKKGGRSDW